MSTKAKGAARRAKGTSKKAQKAATIAAPAPAEVKAGRKPNATSIRQTILAGIAAGQTNAQIAETIKELAPKSMAAAKSSRHISYYRSYAKRVAAAAGE